MTILLFPSLDLFQSTLPQGERLCLSLHLSFLNVFQSTLPQGERPEQTSKAYSVNDISIHAPTRGATMMQTFFRCQRFSISIHAPTRGATAFANKARQDCMISIHAPTRGATSMTVIVWLKQRFQSTLPQGERRRSLVIMKPSVDISIHAPTRGATEPPNQYAVSALISIHAPTRGATLFLQIFHWIFLISIHAPTRGATLEISIV